LEKAYAAAGRAARRGVSPGDPAQEKAPDKADETAAPGRDGGTAEAEPVDENSADKTPGAAGGVELTPEEAEQVRELKARDREVRAHEQAHAAAGGGFAGAPSYEMQTGPDGRRYAVGGEVPIDVSPAATPEATIAKARKIRAAATAPAQPSGADRGIAAEAAAMEAEALREKAEENKKATESAGFGVQVENGGMTAFKAAPTYTRTAEYAAQAYARVAEHATQVFPETGRRFSLAV
jgi:hypothetical protein